MSMAQPPTQGIYRDPLQQKVPCIRMAEGVSSDSTSSQRRS